jgi:type IV pilus assembly protein PilM
MGGNTFTKAIADSFRLNFEKAEKLKRTAPMSKYARQILQAMKPVFADLVSEIQRSLGFYTNSNPATKLAKIIAMGGGTKMRGLVSYLQQTLQIPIERPDSFKRLAINPAVSAAKFHENVCDFGIVYGLALQGLGLTKLENNLLPRSVERSTLWAGKAKYFTAAALALLIVSLMCFGRVIYDKAKYSERYDIRQKVQSIINSAEQAGSELETQKTKEPVLEATINIVMLSPCFIRRYCRLCRTKRIPLSNRISTEPSQMAM